MVFYLNGWARVFGSTTMECDNDGYDDDGYDDDDDDYQQSRLHCMHSRVNWGQRLSGTVDSTTSRVLHVV